MRNGTATLNVAGGQSVAYTFSLETIHRDTTNGVWCNGELTDKRFANVLYGPGMAPDVVNTHGAPYVHTDSQVAVIDPTNLAAQDEILADLTDGLFSALRSTLATRPEGHYQTTPANDPQQAVTIETQQPRNLATPRPTPAKCRMHFRQKNETL